MGKFKNIYPFTTENISGYMKDLNLTNKRIITVNGSGDHVINAIAQGAKEITAFDINPLTEKYLYLKLSMLESLSYKEFLKVLLYDSDKSFDYDIIRDSKMSVEIKKFWLDKLSKYNNNGLALKNSDLFVTKYFNPNSKIWQNIYLEEEQYNFVKSALKNVKIDFKNTSLKDLKIDEDFDYMFLSNISDYLYLMYNNDALKQYKELLNKFQKKIETIYFAYLYDIGNPNPRTEMDDLNKVKNVFLSFEQVEFKTALEGSLQEKKDGVLILKRGGK